jgi:hypothetical protein
LDFFECARSLIGILGGRGEAGEKRGGEREKRGGEREKKERGKREGENILVNPN